MRWDCLKRSFSGLHEFNSNAVGIGDEHQFDGHGTFTDLGAGPLNDGSTAVNEPRDFGIEVVDIDREVRESNLVS